MLILSWFLAQGSRRVRPRRYSQRAHFALARRPSRRDTTVMRIQFLQHVPHETPAHIQDWAAARGHSLRGARLDLGEPTPDVDAFDCLLVMGGPMGANDDATHPWLTEEKRCLERAIAAGRTVIGICLGAQVLAHVLGARVYRNREREIGWFPIDRVGQPAGTGAFAVMPDRLDVLHWHGDTFDLPRGAAWTYRSEGCAHQAYVAHERLYGLQFHLEVRAGDCGNWTEADLADFAGGGRFVQRPEELTERPGRFTTAHRTLDAFLDAVAAAQPSARSEGAP